jgi:hypothetical protein
MSKTAALLTTTSVQFLCSSRKVWLPRPRSSKSSLTHATTSLDQINQLDNGTTQTKSEEPARHSLPTTLGENGGGGNREKHVSELDILLAFEEQEKSLATAPSSPRPHRSAEPQHPQVDQEHDRGGAGNGRSEKLGRGFPLGSQDEGEEPHELEQQEVAAGEEGSGGDDGEERGQWGQKRQHQDEAEEVSSGNHHPKGSDRGHNTSDEDDKDPRPAKKRKLLPAPSDNALSFNKW